MKKYTINEFALYLNGEIKGNASILIDGFSSLALASKTDIACFSNLSQLNLLNNSKVGVVLTTKKLSKYCSKPMILVSIIESLLPKLIEAFNVTKELPILQTNKSIIHPSAVLYDNVQIGKRVKILANVVIESGVSIGDDCIIGANATISKNVIIGRKTIVDSGSCIGAEPYNPIKNNGKWNLIGGVGSVIIGDFVSIGANTVIDNGAHGDTCIFSGVKIDNLVQVAHDVMIGCHTVIAAGAIIGANSVIGSHCTIGGGSSIAGQLKIADDVVLTGRTTVSRSLLKPGIYSSGVTAQPHNIWRKNVARFHRMNTYIKKLRVLINDVDELKKRILE